MTFHSLPAMHMPRQATQSGRTAELSMSRASNKRSICLHNWRVKTRRHKL